MSAEAPDRSARGANSFSDVARAEKIRNQSLLGTPKTLKEQWRTWLWPRILSLQ